MMEQAYNIIKTKDSRTQRQSNLNMSKEARFNISPQEFEDHTLGEIVSLKFFCGGGVGGGGGSTEVVVSVQEDDDAGDAVSCCGAVFAGCGGGRLFWSGWWSVSGRRVAAFSMWSVRIRIDRGVLIGELYLALPENST
ncbi:hypothetical protein Tco_1112892 [Tanacetum coccineum]|uniref:Uncharacterized protein n=1 Tax=Tanacetum coccineum TaxID=301880 RepID=A0ABQ5IQY5_9ASTR